MTCCSKWFRLALWGVVAAVASVASPGTAGASEKGTLTVKDNGSVFTADGVRKAEEAFEGVTFLAPTKLAVVTFGKVPEAKRPAFEAAKAKEDKERFFGEWAKEVARSSGKPDVLIFVSMEGTTVRVLDDRQTDLKRGFDDKDVRTVRDKFVAGFKKTEGEDNAAKLARHDAALLDSVKFVADELKNTTVPANTKRANGAANNGAETKGTSVMTYVCIGIVALLGIWLVIGVVRMMMGGGGGGGGGYGGGGGMMGGGGMGGGGGLMTGLLGGMLGAVAGNYLYNNFMGGNSHSNDSGSSGGGYGDSGTTGDTGAGDYDGGGDSGNGDFGGGDSGGSSGGGDFGGDSGGGDFGGGGGDFGGGGDSGGGDW